MRKPGRPRKRRAWGSWSLSFVKSRSRWRVRAPASVDPARPTRYFKERRSAEQWIAAEQARRALVPAGHDPDQTVEEWLSTWYDTTAGAAEWSEGTKLVYREQLWYWSRCYATRLRDLTTTQLNGIVALLRTVGAEKRPEIPGAAPRRNPRPLAARVIRSACATLERALAAAKDDGLIQRNPASSMVKPRTVSRKPTIWSLKERRLVYAELEKDPLYAVFLAQVEDGLRVGEVLGLQWPDLDFERRVILVRRTVYGQRVQEWPKNHKPREVPMGRYSWAAFIRHRDHGTLRGDLWVFQRPDGKLVHYNQIRYRLLVACRAAGITYRPTHGQRHIHVTELLAAGIPAADVADRVGHTGLATLGDYAHADGERTRQIVDAASAIVGAFLGGSGEQEAQNGALPADSDDATRSETA